jgi:3-hydroxybutyryl-CoA dehydrogenase
MGGGIAQVLARAGIPVVLADASAEQSQQNLDRLIQEAAEFEHERLFEPGSATRITKNISAADSIEDAVRDVDYIAEAVPEVPATKAEVHRRIDKTKRPDAIVGSNTSTIRISSMSAAFADSSKFLGVHFSNPAPFIPGVEIIAHTETSPAVVDSVCEFIQSLEKEPAIIKDSRPGFVLNRIQFAMFKEAVAIVEEGVAAPEEVDTIVSSTFGFRTPFFGPFAIADMAGLDVYKFSFDELHAQFGDRMAPPKLLTDLVESSKLGTKNGGGFTQTEPERTDELIAYRNRAYVKLSELLAELGPAPTGRYR